MTEPSPLLGKAAIRSMLFGREYDSQIPPVDEKNQSVTALAVGTMSRHGSYYQNKVQD